MANARLIDGVHCLTHDCLRVTLSAISNTIFPTIIERFLISYLRWSNGSYCRPGDCRTVPVLVLFLLSYLRFSDGSYSRAQDCRTVITAKRAIVGMFLFLCYTYCRAHIFQDVSHKRTQDCQMVLTAKRTIVGRFIFSCQSSCRTVVLRIDPILLPTIVEQFFLSNILVYQRLCNLFSCM